MDDNSVIWGMVCLALAALTAREARKNGEPTAAVVAIAVACYFLPWVALPAYWVWWRPKRKANVDIRAVADRLSIRPSADNRSEKELQAAKARSEAAKEASRQWDESKSKHRTGELKSVASSPSLSHEAKTGNLPRVAPVAADTPTEIKLSRRAAPVLDGVEPGKVGKTKTGKLPGGRIQETVPSSSPKAPEPAPPTPTGASATLAAALGVLREPFAPAEPDKPVAPSPSAPSPMPQASQAASESASAGALPVAGPLAVPGRITQQVTLIPASQPALAEEPTAPPPPPEGLPAAWVQRFQDSPLSDLSSQVDTLAKTWLAEAGEGLPGMARTEARVKLESATSAVFRGDFRRAVEMVEAVATVLDPTVEAGMILRAGLPFAANIRR